MIDFVADSIVELTRDNDLVMGAALLAEAL